MDQNQFTALVRQLLTFGGSFILANGYANAAQIETGVGALAALAGIGWSVWASRKTGVVTAAAKIPHVEQIVMSPNSSIPANVTSDKVVNG